MNEVAELPQMLLPNLSEDALIRKSSEEMFEYYGIDLADRLTSIGTFAEQSELHPHGFYFDGTFDLNWFCNANGSSECRLREAISDRFTNGIAGKCCR